VTLLQFMRKKGLRLKYFNPAGVYPMMVGCGFEHRVSVELIAHPHAFAYVEGIGISRRQARRNLAGIVSGETLVVGRRRVRVSRGLTA
jgi:hypothetical protein